MKMPILIYYTMKKYITRYKRLTTIIAIPVLLMVIFIIPTTLSAEPPKDAEKYFDTIAK
jgi:hypothetical protein